MKYLHLVFALLFVMGCKKDKAPLELEGIYTGTFTAYSGDRKIDATVEISFTDGRYAVLKGYKGGSGTFTVLNKKEINFEDENIWTAEFDWALLLKGKYEYQTKGDVLVFTKQAFTGSCFYVKI